MDSIVKPYPAETDDPDPIERIANGDEATIYLRQGSAYAQKGCFEQAMEAFQRAISLQPDSALAYLGLGGVYLELHCRQEAADAFQRAIDIEPNLLEAHYGYGISSGQVGRFEEAIRALEQARTLLSIPRVKPNIPSPDPPVPTLPKPGLFSRLFGASRTKQERTLHAPDPDPVDLRAAGLADPRSRNDHRRPPSALNILLLTGLLALVSVGIFLLAPGSRNAMVSDLSAHRSTARVSNRSNSHAARMAHRTDSTPSTARIPAKEPDHSSMPPVTHDANTHAETDPKAGAPLLIQAADRGDSDQVDALLAQNVDPNAKDPQGNPVLMHAVDGHHIDITRDLLKHGADVHFQSAKGITALMSAVLNDDRETVRLLARYGADMNIHAGNNDTALTLAVGLGKYAMTKELLDLGADPSQPGESGKTALDTAALLGHQDILDLLKKYTSRREHNHTLSLIR